MTDETNKANEEVAGTDETKVENTTPDVETNEAAQPESTTENANETDWTAEAKKWEARSKQNFKELTDLKKVHSDLEQQVSELQNFKTEAEANKTALETAQHQILIYKVAAAHGVSNQEDIDLFLTGTDEETLNKQAQRISTGSSHAPRPDSAQGTRNNPGPLSGQQQRVSALQDLLNN